MRVLVTGSVLWTDPAPLERALDDLLAKDANVILITGMADGADAIARRWAIRNEVPVWAEALEEGEYPGPMHRYNQRMLRWEPDVVVACKANLNPVHNPDAGTEHMWRIALAAGVPTRWLQDVDELS